MGWLVCEVLSHGGEVPLHAGEAGSFEPGGLPHMAIYALEALMGAGVTDEAERRAREIAKQRGAAPGVLLKAAAVLFQLTTDARVAMHRAVMAA
jgi:hypothetical protein